MSYVPDVQDLSEVSGCFLSLAWANQAFLKLGVMLFSILPSIMFRCISFSRFLCSIFLLIYQVSFILWSHS